MDALHNINNNRMMLNGITDFRSYNTGNAVGSTRNTPSVYQNNLGMLNSGTASYNDMMLSQLLSGGFASGTTSSQSNKTSALEIFATVMTGIASLAAVVLPFINFGGKSGGAGKGDKAVKELKDPGYTVPSDIPNSKRGINKELKQIDEQIAFNNQKNNANQTVDNSSLNQRKTKLTQKLNELNTNKKDKKNATTQTQSQTANPTNNTSSS